MSLPDLESLRCFVLAATRANFRVAARAAALSPAAFGARIRRLEEQFGQRLFVRTTRRVALTRRGSELLPLAQRCIAEAEDCAMPADHDASAPFDIVMGTRFDVGMHWVVPAFGALESLRPERRLHITFGDVDELEPRMQRDEVHCILTTARMSSTTYAFAPFREVDYVLVGAPRLIQKLPLNRAEDAPQHLLIDFEEELPLFRFFREARPSKENWTFRSVQFLSIIAAVRARVLEGVGVAVLPVFYVAEDLRRGRLVALLPETRLKSNFLRAVWRKGHPYESEIRSLAFELADRAAGKARDRRHKRDPVRRAAHSI